MENRAFQEEEAYLEKVEEYIDRRIAVLLEKKEELRQDISAGRKDMWESGRHGVSDFDDVVDLYLHSEGIVADEKQYVENLKELQRLENMKGSPYFARIDVEEEGYSGEESIYIGAVGLRNDKTHDMYVCDWRAPVSALFYGFDVGKAWYEVNGRRLHVDLKRKRQIQVADGRLQNIYDTDSAMHDVILGGILSENTGNKLKVIVSSIQKEQNMAIRKTDKQAVLIYGPAGSGKTSVGLHRLAFILYQQREGLTSSDIVILSNNNIYHSYVSGILPALCEDEVSHTIFHELLRKFLPRELFVESYYTQYEVLRCGMDKRGNYGVGENIATQQDRRTWLRVKYSREMLRFVQSYFAEYDFKLPDLKYRSHTVATAEELRNKVNRNRYEDYRSKLEGVTETIKKLYEDYFTEHQTDICEELEAKVKEYVSSQELEILFIKAKRRAIQEALDTFYKQNRLDAGEQLVCVTELFVKMQGDNIPAGQGMAAILQKNLEKRYLWYEDALLYLLVRILMGEVPPFQNVLHVLIDEAQDYNLLQLMILKLLYPRSAFTLLADVCQAISPVTTIGSYEEFEEVFGEQLDKLPLLKSYRSSGAINALAFHFMDKFQKEYARKYSYFSREGKVPQFIHSNKKFETMVEKLKEWKSYNMIGIIVKDERAANQTYQSLFGKVENLQLITKPYDEMKARIIIMPLILTKGLEFDAVIISGLVKELSDVSMKREDAVDGKFAELYLACTRALHELCFVEEQDLPEEMMDCKEYLEIVNS